MHNTEVGQTIARSLLEIKAIKLSPADPFTWSSGWISPIYCDNRLALSYPEIRDTIKNALSDEIKSMFSDVEAIAGVATAGIPQGALVADRLNLPFIYVRSKPKGHGMGNMIEGKVIKGQRTVVLEDLISTGGSSLKAVEALRDAGVEVLGLAAIFSYGFDLSASNFQEAKVPFFTLSNYDLLLNEALELNYISSEQLESLQNWKKDPANWRS